MEVVHFSETLVTTRRLNPEDHNEQRMKLLRKKQVRVQKERKKRRESKIMKEGR
jgi:hypothetical protein